MRNVKNGFTDKPIFLTWHDFTSLVSFLKEFFSRGLVFSCLYGKMSAGKVRKEKNYKLKDEWNIKNIGK